MNESLKNKLPIIGAVTVGIVLVILLVALSRGPSKNDLQPIVFVSPYAGSNDNVAPNYRGETDANSNAAKQHFVIYNLNGVQLPDVVKTNLANRLGAVLAKEIAPTQDTSFIQIVPKTIKCNDLYDCAFSFYIDSPESYYNYRLFYTSNGAQVYTLTRLALPGGKS